MLANERILVEDLESVLEETYPGKATASHPMPPSAIDPLPSQSEARGALGWSVQDLAAKTGVGSATIVRYETFHGIPPSRKDNLKLIRAVLESAGIEFIGTPDDGPGIRIRRPGTAQA